jgi:putative sugar O-methyltransferase
MTDFDTNLANMLKGMETADSAFKPTNFWSSGLPSIMKDIDELGVETFRDHPSAAFFYVPVYASNTLRSYGRFVLPIANNLPARKKAKFMRRLTRSDRALADYRLMLATSVQGGLAIEGVSESDVGGGERFDFDGRSFSRSMLNYMRALNLYKRHADGAQVTSILEIGGGYGTLGEILLKAVSDGFYVNVDIPPVAAVSTYYLQKVFGADNVLTYTDAEQLDEIDLDALKSRYRAVVLCPWQLPKIKGQVDMFANFMSFQEMEPDVVRNYIKLVQPLIKDHVLVRNSAVGKKVAAKKGDIGVIEQVKSGFIQEQFDAFDTVAADAFVYGEENETGTYRSEVCVLKRR